MAGQAKKTVKTKSGKVSRPKEKTREDKDKKTSAPGVEMGDGKKPKRASTPSSKRQSSAVKTASIVVKSPPAVQASGDHQTFTKALCWVPGTRLAEVDPSGTPAWDQGRRAAEEHLEASAEELSLWQEKLFAAGKGGGTTSVLLVVQGMDTSGKGGILRHVVGQCDPQGIDLTSFKAPTAEERAHPFLWRIRAALPAAGKLGVFDRSHYEDVLIARVQNLAPRATIGRRYSQIVAFEKGLVAAGTVLIKVMLHISEQEQAVRLQERIERPDKNWKYNPGDIDQRLRWAEYQEAYEVALDKTSTDDAPWFVIPADRKWYARLAVHQLLVEHLRTINPQWPSPSFSPAEELERLRASNEALAAQK